MFGIPRRLLRQLGYAAFLLCVAIILLFLANHKKLIALGNYLPSSFIPSFFQPKDSYIVDISIKKCFKLNDNSERCGTPTPTEGRMGNLYDSGGWVKIEKDLTLGSSWLNKEYFSYKRVSYEAMNGGIRKQEFSQNSKKDLDGSAALNNLVIVDIAISNPKVDALIEGNSKLKLPKQLLNDINSKRVFDDTQYQSLVEAERSKMNGEKIQAASTDKENSASNKIKAMEMKKEGASKEVEEEKDNMSGSKAKRKMETSRHDLIGYYKIPSNSEIAEHGWFYKANGIWIKYGPLTDSNAITGIDILFGEDSVDPRPNWKLLKYAPLSGIGSPSGRKAYLSIRRGPRLDYGTNEYRPGLKFDKDGKFKILQVADLHFSTGVGKCRDPVPGQSKDGCEADPRTLKFLEKVLDIEKPDFVVLTGDQIFGDEAPDSATAIFKALNPFISRKIPFAVTLGNHDDEGSLKRNEVMALSSNLPFSLSDIGMEEVAGSGNYALTVKGSNSKNSAMSLYFLDTHKYSLNPKVTPGYDWIKESQLKWIELEAESLKADRDTNNPHLSMAFFHIPLPEYRNLGQSFKGENREGVTAPRYNTGARTVLQRIGVQVTSVGHDHCNDYCLQDTQGSDIMEENKENKIWLCYGGGSGEGGYGGYNNYVRRLRIFDIDSKKGEIKSWKRAESDPSKSFDLQTLVLNGNVVDN